MNLQTNPSDTNNTKILAPSNLVPNQSTTRREHRERDFGVGYGSSSGYGFDKRYTSDWGQPRFLCR